MGGRNVTTEWTADAIFNADKTVPNKDGRIVLLDKHIGSAVKVNDGASEEASQGVVFSPDGTQILVQMDVERAIGVFAIRDGKLVDTGTRIALAAGPVSIRSMPR